MSTLPAVRHVFLVTRRGEEPGPASVHLHFATLLNRHHRAFILNGLGAYLHMTRGVTFEPRFKKDAVTFQPSADEEDPSNDNYLDLLRHFGIEPIGELEFMGSDQCDQADESGFIPMMILQARPMRH